MPLPRLDKLKSILLRSSIQQENAALFQVINSLIDYLQQSNLEIITVVTGSGSGSGLANQHYLTTQNDLGNLPNSSQILAGTNITFDTSVPGQLTVNVTIPPALSWAVLSNGDPINPEIIFADGVAIMVNY